MRDASTSALLPYKSLYIVFTSPFSTDSPEYIITTSSAGTYSYTADPSIIDHAGTWTAQVTFKNDSAYNVATASSSFSVGKANTSISLYVNATNVSPSTPVKASGKLSFAGSGVPVDLSNKQIIIDFIEPNGNTVHSVVDPSNGKTYDFDGYFKDIPYSFFSPTGIWTAKARFAGDADLNPSESNTWEITSTNAAGYAIIIEGDFSGTYRANYTNSLDDIYDKLLDRQFSSEDIYYLSYEGVGYAGVNALTSQTNIQNAINTWAKGRILEKGIAPLYIIMMDHGSPGKFHIDPSGTQGADEFVTPAELHGWLNTLEADIKTATGFDLNTVVINGSCYSGSFIDTLSKQNRVIITSSDSTEESAQGPSHDGTTYGEYFIYYLFNHLTKGATLKEAFKDAADIAGKLRECKSGPCLTNSPKYGDYSRQHPLLDDNGDHLGSGGNSIGQSDGVLADGITLGLGSNPITLAWQQKMPTTTVTLGSGLTAYAILSGSSTVAWAELKKPSYVMPDTGGTGTGQVVMALPSITGSHVGSGRWEFSLSNVSELNEAGTYTIYYYAMDTSQNIIAPAIGTIYVDTVTNQAPGVPGLLSPIQDAETTSMILFEWQEVTDPDSDPVTYTIRLYEDNSGSKGSEIKRYELIPQGAFAINDATVETRNDGITTLFELGRHYWWDVEAIDNYGRSSISAAEEFAPNLSNPVLPGLLTGFITDYNSGVVIPSATITFSTGGSTSSLSNGSYMKSLSAGAVNITVSATGYQTSAPVPVTILSGNTVTKNISLVSTGDSTPPTGNIVIDSGSTYTNSTSVTLTLSATDSGGVSQMKFSNDNSNWSTAEAYSTGKAWTMTGGEGIKTVYVKYKDNAGNWSGSFSDTIELILPTKIGIFDHGTWYLDSNQSWAWEGTPSDTLGVFGIGLTGAIPVVGDWNGDGSTKIGVYMDGLWYLDVNRSWAWDGEPTDTMGVFGIGLEGEIPVVGDWNGDGITKIGVYMDGLWYLDVNGNWQWDGEGTDQLGVFGIGLTGEVPVVGDWNGDGISEIGIYQDGIWYLDKNRSWQWEGEPSDTYGVFGIGLTNEVPVVGDWNGDGVSEIGIYQEGLWYLDKNRSWQWEGEPTDQYGVFGIGLTDVVPVPGKW